LLFCVGSLSCTKLCETKKILETPKASGLNLKVFGAFFGDGRVFLPSVSAETSVKKYEFKKKMADVKKKIVV
jgi:hypothetical protein